MQQLRVVLHTETGGVNSEVNAMQKVSNRIERRMAIILALMAVACVALAGMLAACRSREPVRYKKTVQYAEYGVEIDWAAETARVYIRNSGDSYILFDGYQHAFRLRFSDDYGHSVEYPNTEAVNLRGANDYDWVILGAGEYSVTIPIPGLRGVSVKHLELAISQRKYSGGSPIVAGHACDTMVLDKITNWDL